MVVKASEISVALAMALSAAFLTLEAFLGLVGAFKAWELADSLASGAWIVSEMTGTFRACKGDLICVVTFSLSAEDWEPWIALVVSLFVLLAFVG